MYFFFEIYTLKNVNHFFGFLICLTFFSNFLADFFLLVPLSKLAYQLPLNLKIQNLRN